MNRGSRVSSQAAEKLMNVFYGRGRAALQGLP
jgi:hypothetical protein